VDVLAGLGAEIVEVRLPYFAETATAAGVTAYAEAFAQYRDGLRDRWDDLFVASRTLLAVGALISAPDYVQAQRVRRAAQRALAVVFAGVDLVVMPTSTRPAPTHAEMRDGAFDFPALLRAMHTPYWNATGHPVLAIPVGFTAGGLPMGLQIAGRPFDEATVLRAGDAYQRRTDWHLRVPPAASALLEPAA
jgi:aspartyl-tRNA(Asn)/glutamyl-tRNA(Gln) amidotransferase subunit A